MTRTKLSFELDDHVNSSYHKNDNGIVSVICLESDNLPFDEYQFKVNGRYGQDFKDLVEEVYFRDNPDKSSPSRDFLDYLKNQRLSVKKVRFNPESKKTGGQIILSGSDGEEHIINGVAIDFALSLVPLAEVIELDDNLGYG